MKITVGQLRKLVREAAGDMMPDSQLRSEISGIIHDHGDEDGWGSVPSVSSILSDLADRLKHSGWKWDHAKARQFAEEAVARSSASSKRSRRY